MGHLEARRHALEEARDDERANAERARTRPAGRAGCRASPSRMRPLRTRRRGRRRRARDSRSSPSTGSDSGPSADLHRLGVEEADRAQAELGMIEQPDRGQPADAPGADDDRRRGRARARAPPGDDEIGAQPADREQNRREQPEAQRGVDTGLIGRLEGVDREDRHRRDGRRREREAEVVERLEPEPLRVSAPAGHEADDDRVEQRSAAARRSRSRRGGRARSRARASRRRRAARASSTGGAATAPEPERAAP